VIGVSVKQGDNVQASESAQSWVLLTIAYPPAGTLVTQILYKLTTKGLHRLTTALQRTT